MSLAISITRFLPKTGVHDAFDDQTSGPPPDESPCNLASLTAFIQAIVASLTAFIQAIVLFMLPCFGKDLSFGSWEFRTVSYNVKPIMAFVGQAKARPPCSASARHWVKVRQSEARGTRRGVLEQLGFSIAQTGSSSSISPGLIMRDVETSISLGELSKTQTPQYV
eukprot:GHVO01023360.1.p1 GENE.GHVO01023360.1~~GHVO01023360.1.p1  ORF type:complete len:166 (+),score=6.52 GHVO01023360.1:202-699(+)